MPVLHIATHIAEPFDIVDSSFKYLAQASTGIVADVVAEASPVNCGFDFAAIAI
jgi:hypothetical protein